MGLPTQGFESGALIVECGKPTGETRPNEPLLSCSWHATPTCTAVFVRRGLGIATSSVTARPQVDVAQCASVGLVLVAMLFIGAARTCHRSPGMNRSVPTSKTNARIHRSGVLSNESPFGLRLGAALHSDCALERPSATLRLSPRRPLNGRRRSESAAIGQRGTAHPGPACRVPP